MTKFTIIVGKIEFFPTHALINSIDEVYQASNLEELEALEDTFDRDATQDEGKDYLTIETYTGRIEVTNETLKALIWG
jgi:hypothetical protein